MIEDALKPPLRPLIPSKLRPRLKALFYAGVKVYYGGDRCLCPICGTRLRKFAPCGYKFPVLKEKGVVGGGYYRNVQCPICGSLDRVRLLYLYLLHKTDIFRKPQKILHVAPETRIGNRIRRVTGVDYLTADLNPEGVMVKMDIMDIQFPDNSFDVIICNHVLEHVGDDQKAMRELYRTLKPGGWAILQVPISLVLSKTYEDASITTRAGREQAFGQWDHVRIHARDYKDRLERAGFKVNIFQWTTEIEKFGTERNIFGLNEKEGIYHVMKPDQAVDHSGHTIGKIS
jgi:predicted SAM-dependent methyltransferase